MTDCKERFLLTNEYDDKTLIIIDYTFWNENDEAISKWLIENTARGLNTREGMMMYFDSPEEVIWFLMKWN